MIVCIAEKPSVARDIAEVLGARDRKEGYIEGNGYQVTWTFGHLCTLKEPHDYTPNWKSWSLGSLPMIPPRFGIKLISNPTYERQFATIEGLMQKADMIINCGDAGQEGELIQRWVMQKAGAKCPVKRLWISSLTEEAIRDGFAKLRDASDFQPLYEAGLSRAIGDWLLGMNATRLYTIKYGQNRQVLSIGRVQTPTLALIVNRQQEIEHFVPKQYWVLSTVYRDTTFNALIRKSDEDIILDVDKQIEGNKKLAGLSDEQLAAAKAELKARLDADNLGIDPIEDHARGEELMQRIETSPFTVTSVSKKNGREAPLRLFDLTSLQVECNKKFAFSADDTLKTIQSLYEKKVATYPRVDTTYLSDDIYPKCPQILKGLRDYATLTAPLEGKALIKSKKVFDNSKVTDHHAIIPTGQYPQGLTNMEKLVYDLIARRFIAVFYPDCLFSTTTVMGEVEQIVFKATGRQILDQGWRVVMMTDAAASDDSSDPTAGGKTLPVFTQGESGPHEPTLQEKWTTPPSPYTEATLLRAMETAGKFVDNDELRDAMKENGIGRPSTRAAIIETLFKRNYIRKERKNLIATPTGIELIQLIHEELLKSAELTGIWEKKLREIEKRTYQAGQFLEELKQMVGEVVMSVLSDNSNRRVTIVNPEEEKAKEKAKKSAATAKKRAPRKKAEGSQATVQPDSSASQPAASASQPAAVPASLSAVAPAEGSVCPLCSKGTIIKGKAAYGCSEWRNGCKYRKPFA